MKTYLLYSNFIFCSLFFIRTSVANNPLRGTGMCFTENRGQVADTEGNQRPDVLYTGDGGGISVFLRTTGISYVLSKSDELPEEKDNETLLTGLKHYTHRIDADFEDCNINSFIEKRDEVEGYKNFYLAHCSNGIIHVKSYNTLIQRNIYDNIDIVYKGSKADGLKYDLVINPGGNPTNIKIKYGGYDDISLTSEGELLIVTTLGEIKENMPRVYQNINGKIINVKAGYVLVNEDPGSSTVGFSISSYNTSYPLIIDPWISYFGGAKNEYGNSVSTDSNGNIIFTGSTDSQNFPLLGAYQGSLYGPTDAFVAKLSEAGILQWSTYYGGASYETGYDVCADRNTGDIYLVGETYSSNFPTGAVGGNTSYIPSLAPGVFPGTIPGFIVKLNSGGTRLWATYLGRSKRTTLTQVTTDQNNNPIVCGYTSYDSLSSPGTFQTTHNGTFDAVVAKFTPTGNFSWATYCGGNGSDAAYHVSCDLSNNIYFSGSTQSSNFPVTAGCHQPIRGGGPVDGFLFKLDQSGNGVWGTYYGGAGIDIAFDVQVSAAGEVYINGQTTSNTNISTPGSFQPSLAGGTKGDAFLVKFNSSGVRQWGTYLGGSVGPNAPFGANGTEYATGLAIDANNNVIVSGDTYSIDFPITSCAYQTQFLGTENQFLSTFAPNGQIVCSGYFGMGNSTSANNETEIYGGSSIATYNGKVYLIAYTQNNYPVTANAFQSVYGGGAFDAVIAQLCVTTCGLSDITVDLSADKEVLCQAGDSINFTVQNTSCSQQNTNYFWSFQGASPPTSTSPNPTNIIYADTGTFSVKLLIETPCGKDSIIKNAFIRVGTNKPVASFTATPQPASISNPNINFINQSTGAAQYAWSFGDQNNSFSNLVNPSYTYQDSGKYIVRLIATNSDGCSDTTEQTIVIEGIELYFYVPNSFTPNGDGKNDVFSFKIAGADENQFLMLIYDRWGNLIYTGNNQQDWNGRVRNVGETAQIDTYVWKVMFTDLLGKKYDYIGHVNLIR